MVEVDAVRPMSPNLGAEDSAKRSDGSGDAAWMALHSEIPGQLLSPGSQNGPAFFWAARSESRDPAKQLSSVALMSSSNSLAVRSFDGVERARGSVSEMPLMARPDLKSKRHDIVMSSIDSLDAIKDPQDANSSAAQSSPPTSTTAIRKNSRPRPPPLTNVVHELDDKSSCSCCVIS